MIASPDFMLYQKNKIKLLVHTNQYLRHLNQQFLFFIICFI